MRKLITDEPFIDRSLVWFNATRWPAKWVAPEAERQDRPRVVAYRLRFTLQSPQTIRIHVSADERYELYVGGQRIGRGPERGAPHAWFYETYDLDFPAGENVIVARTWWFGEDAPLAQMSVRHGFLLAAQNQPPELLNTGSAGWECKEMGGFSLLPSGEAWGAGKKFDFDGSKFDWDFAAGGGDGWKPAVAIAEAASARGFSDLAPVWQLRPAMLPPMYEAEVHAGVVRSIVAIESTNTERLAVDPKAHIAPEAKAWDAMLAGKSSVTIPPKTKRRLIVDLQNYYCAYPQLVTTGGAGSMVRILWAESLVERLPESGKSEWLPLMPKGNRNEVDGRYLFGVGDTFRPDGGTSRLFEPLWWEAGRYLEIVVVTAETPLTIEKLSFRETHYPHDFRARFEVSDQRLESIIPLARRVIEMCSHETYMDCPWYEQLMYVGDTRLEVLVTYLTTPDDRLPRKAIEMFDVSRQPSGLTQSRFPSRVLQMIPPFSLWWVGMVWDFAHWRDDLAFVKTRMPGVRGVLDYYRSQINKDGLLESPLCWNFMDWVPAWQWGNPPGGLEGQSGILNLQLALILKLAAELEECVGEPMLAQRNRQDFEKLMARIEQTFFDDGRRLFADDPGKNRFSEHAQCLAILAGSEKPSVDALLSEELSRTTIYFDHYLFETLYKVGRTDRLIERLDLWMGLAANGLKTTIEMPEPTRSDCHAWGAHPWYHFFASLLGIRPAEPGFRSVRIAPRLGTLSHARGTIPHPRGELSVSIERKGERLSGSILLPPGVGGVFIDGDRTVKLNPGENTV
jgi:alpha-L-rhamnosidase